MHLIVILVYRVILLVVCALYSRRLGGVTYPIVDVVSSSTLWFVVRIKFRPRSVRRRGVIRSREE